MKDLAHAMRYTKEGEKYHTMVNALKELVELDEGKNAVAFFDNETDDLEYHIKAAREAHYAGEREELVFHWGEAGALYFNTLLSQKGIEQHYQDCLAARTKVLEQKKEMGKEFDIPEYQFSLEQKLDEVNQNLLSIYHKRIERLEEVTQLYRLVDEEENLTQVMRMEEEQLYRQREVEKQEQRDREGW